MKNIKFLTYSLFLLVIFIVFFTSCPTPQEEKKTEPAPINYVTAQATSTYTGPGPEVFHLATNGYVELSYDLDLGANTKNVYFVFTNTASSDSTINPTVVANSIIPQQQQNLNYESKRSLLIIDEYKGDSRFKTKIDDFNRNPTKYLVDTPVKNNLNKNMISKPLFDVENSSTNSFMNEATTDLIPATCRKVVSNGTKTLNIWVANDCWTTGGTKAYLVTQPMVDALAAKFLQSGTGTDDDIYDWVSNIYGAEWGTTIYTNLITLNNEITILLFDIDKDNSTNGGTVGFFWSKDNYKSSGDSSVPYSNQRIMFYLDAVMFATPGDGGTNGVGWDITDSWPSNLISTLAHEFQHMIHFYQKIIKNKLQTGSETWLNEMCSLVTEDFVADKLQVSGPRGVTVADAGSTGNTTGRIPRYNYYNDDSLTYWGWTDNNILRSYSIDYSYGAYLARNFGGVTLFQNIVQNTNTDYQAITNALVSQGFTGETFQTSLQKWGAAVLLSDNTLSLPTGGYQYNTGNWVSSTINSTIYNLGSINFFNYQYSTSGPYIYTTSPVGSESTYTKMSGYSNRFYYVGNLTGLVKQKIKMDNNVKLTVVVK